MLSRMSPGDEIDVLEGYRATLRDCLATLDPAAVLKLRGELQVLSQWLAVQKKSAVQRTADEALDAVSRFYLYGQEIDGLRASNRSAETASYYDLASVGVLAVENVVTADHPTLMRFLMSGLSEGLMFLGRPLIKKSGLSEGLMFLGSRQYVSGSDAVLLASWRKHSTAVRDGLWSLATDFRDLESLASIRAARAAIDDLFVKFDDPGVALATRLALLYQLYALVAVIRCAKLFEDLRGPA